MSLDLIKLGLNELQLTLILPTIYCFATVYLEERLSSVVLKYTAHLSDTKVYGIAISRIYDIYWSKRVFVDPVAKHVNIVHASLTLLPITVTTAPFPPFS